MLKRVTLITLGVVLLLALTSTVAIAHDPIEELWEAIDTLIERVEALEEKEPDESAEETATPVPTGTPNPAPTVTPSPTPEATATPLPTGEDGTSRAQACPYGIKCEAGVLDIRVTDVDMDAWPEIQEFRSTAKPPEEGHTYATWTIWTKNSRGSLDKSVTSDWESYSLTGSYGQSYHARDYIQHCNHYGTNFGNRDVLHADLYLGGEEEGIVCFHIPEDETDFILTNRSTQEDADGRRTEVETWLKASDE